LTNLLADQDQDHGHRGWTEKDQYKNYG